MFILHFFFRICAIVVNYYQYKFNSSKNLWKNGSYKIRRRKNNLLSWALCTQLYKRDGVKDVHKQGQIRHKSFVLLNV